MKKFSKIKVALFYDWLNQWGGAEQVLLDLLKIFPQSDIFTSVHDKKNTPWLRPNYKVNTSILNKTKLFKKNSIISALLQPIAFEQFNFDSYDIVISLTSLQGKCLLTSPKTLHLCYCLTPNRYLYQPNINKFIDPFVNIYRHIDYVYAQRPDHFIAISKTVQNRITKYYHRSSTVIYPGINTGIFTPISNSKNNYFLIAGRLVPHKKVDLAIAACIQANSPLKIIGQGRDYPRLLKIAQNNKLIEFVGQVDQSQLISYYQNCRALICPQLEDFGLTAIEAQSCGKPVIAYGKGGYAETIIDGQTGLLFPEQSTTSLLQAIKIFPNFKFDSNLCRQNASRFSQPKFMLDFKSLVVSLWEKHQQITTIL